MKEIHPTYYPEAKILCACGAMLLTGSTMPEIHVEICSTCHPFYTGKQKLIDTARRVEKYEERTAAKTSQQVTSKKTKNLKRAAQKAAKKAQKKPTTLHEV